MPEIAEVEKLKKQMERSFIGRTIKGFSMPNGGLDPRKIAQQGWTNFRVMIVERKVERIERIGKNLWLLMEGEPAGGWHVHLNSTGWFMPGNEVATKAAIVNPIHENFLHKMNQDSVRVRIKLDDGQVWNYHDGRTWGKWWFRAGNNPKTEPYFATYGPDWLYDPVAATAALIACKSRRTLKDVLCDQTVVADARSYLSCEIAHHAGIHPHRSYVMLSQPDRTRLSQAVLWKVYQAMHSDTHEHWAVFKRKGEPCPKCKTPVEYVKDGGGARGSYFCPKCQPKA